MAKVTMTYPLAMAAGRDAGNRSMRRAGRNQWDEDDWNAAAETFERLRGKENGLPEGENAVQGDSGAAMTATATTQQRTGA